MGAGVRRVRELSPDSRVLMLTASPNEAAAVVALESGCVGVVPKTLSLDDLVAAVREAATGRLNLDSDMLARLVPRLSRSYREPGADLTSREREVLRLVAEGLSTPDMAARLVVSTNTVRNHVQSILTKLGAHSKLEALVIANRSTCSGSQWPSATCTSEVEAAGMVLSACLWSTNRECALFVLRPRGR